MIISEFIDMLVSKPLETIGAFFTGIGMLYTSVNFSKFLKKKVENFSVFKIITFVSSLFFVILFFIVLNKTFPFYKD
jgi:hypothetical protein